MGAMTGHHYSFSTDGDLLAAASGTGEVTVWKTINGALQIRLGSSKWSAILCLVWSVATVKLAKCWCGWDFNQSFVFQFQGCRKRKKRSSVVIQRILAIGGGHGISVWDVGKNVELHELVSDHALQRGGVVMYHIITSDFATRLACILA